jgi:deoxycytidine triphosphate deaminase
MYGPLNGEEIKTANLIKNGVDASFRAASYDIRVGVIVSPDGRTCDEFTISAGGIVQVISDENVVIPPDIMGYALIKTSLCNEGILALSIGILDPGYTGKLASALLNFGQNVKLIKKGDVFLRLTFHKISPTSSLDNLRALTDSQYTKDVQQRMLTYFSSGSFLNVDEAITKSTEQQLRTWRTQIFTWIPVLAVFLTMMTFLLNFSALWSIQRVFQPSDIARAEVTRTTLEQQTSDIDNAQKALLRRIDGLEAAVEKIAQTRTAPQTDIRPGQRLGR